MNHCRGSHPKTSEEVKGWSTVSSLLCVDKGGSTASRETSVQEAFGLFFSRLAMDILTLHAIDQPVEYV